MKNIILPGILMIHFFVANAQTTKTPSIEDCYSMAKNNYPLIKQLELITKTKEYSVDNATRGYLPQFNIYAQASYQSAVTEIPFKIPGFPISSLNKDQYKFYGEVNQSLTDAVFIKQQKRVSFRYQSLIGMSQGKMLKSINFIRKG